MVTGRRLAISSWPMLTSAPSIMPSDVFGAGREPHCKHYEDVAEDAFDDEAHKGRAHFGSCYRDRTLAGSTGVEAAVREKDCQKEAARKVGKIYHDPALKQLRRCDLPVQDAEGQQVVAGEELSAAQDDQQAMPASKTVSAAAVDRRKPWQPKPI